MTRSLAPDKENAIRAFDLMDIPPQGYAVRELALPRNWPPSRLRTVRVYEMAPRIPVGVDFKSEPPEAANDELDILRDVLLDQRYDRARELVRGWAGPWRASGSVIDLIDLGRNMYLFGHVVATSVWWAYLDCDAPPNDSYELRVHNQTDVQTLYRADLVFGPGW